MRLEHFAEPPTKATKELLAVNNIIPPKNETDLLIDQINAKEEECLKTVHTRYCIINGLPIHITDVSRFYPNKKQMPGFYEYWYKFNTKAKYMLMSRDLKAEDGKPPVLTILFNRELIREGE